MLSYLWSYFGTKQKPPPTIIRKQKIPNATELMKIVLTGDAGVGKTSIINMFINKHFQSEYKQATIGINLTSEHLMNVEGYNPKLQIWDRAGPERFVTITPLYYRGASGLCVVYDITCRNSFRNVVKWIEDAYRSGCESIIILVGNKIDLVQERKVKEHEGRELASKYGALFIETSAKEYSTIYSAFFKLAQAVIVNNTREELVIINGELFNGKKDYREVLWQDNIFTDTIIIHNKLSVCE
jgi:small GTP-binding protein